MTGAGIGAGGTALGVGSLVPSDAGSRIVERRRGGASAAASDGAEVLGAEVLGAEAFAAAAGVGAVS